MSILQPPAGAQIEKSPGGLIWVDDNRIIVAVDTGELEHTVEHAKIVVEIFRRLSGNTPLPLLADFTNLRTVRREVREYYSSEECQRIYKATAVGMMTRSVIGRMVANFIMGIHSPQVPTKLFTDPDAAVGWLKAYVPQEQFV